MDGRVQCEVWVQYGDGQPLLVKWPETARVRVVDDLKYHILSQMRSRVDPGIANIELSKYGQVLVPTMSTTEALHGVTFSQPLAVEEIMKGQAPAGLNEEWTVKTHASQRGLCSELMGLLYHEDFELKLNIPDTILYHDGDFDRRVFTQPSRSGAGEIGRQSRYMDHSEQKNKLLRNAKVDSTGQADFVAVFRFDDNNIRTVTAQALPRVLRSIKSSTNKNLNLSRAEVRGERIVQPPRWQCVRSYVHPLNDIVYCCTYEEGRTRDLRMKSRKPWGSRDVKRKERTGPSAATEVIPYYYSERYRNFDRYQMQGEERLYDRPEFDPTAGLIEVDAVPETVARECKRLTSGLVSFFRKVYNINLVALSCDFIQDEDRRLILTDISSAQVQGNEQGGTVEGRAMRTRSREDARSPHHRKGNRGGPRDSDRSLAATVQRSPKRSGRGSQPWEDGHVGWLEEQQETEKERVDRLYEGRSSTRGKIKDWKQIATEHMKEVERLNKEALDNEKLWDAFLQKVVDANHKLETQKKHLTAENEALKRTVFKNVHRDSFSPRATERLSRTSPRGTATRPTQSSDTSVSKTFDELALTTQDEADAATNEKTIQVLHDTLGRQRETIRRLEEEIEQERQRNQELHDRVDESRNEMNNQKDDITANAQIRNELLARLDSADTQILNGAKLVDLLRDFDPEGVEDMRRLLQEIEGSIVLTDSELERLLQKDDHWKTKKRDMSEKIQALFDSAVSIEQRRKRLRFEQTAAFMWAMKPGTTRKERAIMESLYTLDREKGHPKADVTSFDPADPAQERSHQLFARLMESEAGMGLLPTSNLGVSSSYRRRLYDHSRDVKKLSTRSKVGKVGER